MSIDDTEAPIRDAYERNAEYWIRVVREGLDPYQQQITDPALLSAIGDPSGNVFLDAGCGEGHFSRQLVERGARHVHGVDICGSLIRAAAAHNAADPRTSTFYRADVAHLPLADHTVDVVCCNRLPHALGQPQRRFTEFARVLRPGGRLVQLSLHPCFYAARDERDDPAQQPISARDYFQGRTVVQHFNVDGLSPAPSVQRFYSLETHARLITQAGFTITDISEPRPQDLLIHHSDRPKAFHTPLFLLIVAKLSQ